MAGLPRAVRIVEVGPRDGLQNEPTPLTVADRIAFIRALHGAGLRDIEAGSFVSPRAVPHMAGSGAVLAGLAGLDARLSVLVPNLRGLQDAAAAGARDVAVFVAASESFSGRNTQCSVTEGLDRARTVAAAALADGRSVRGYISCVTDCPYEGQIAPDIVVRLARDLLDAGCREISLGETIGAATPLRVAAMLEAVSAQVPVERLAVHFHQTFGQALANVLVALEHGVSVVDASVAGLGGCPYAPGAAGNVASEDVLYMLDGMRIATGVDLSALAAAGWAICEKTGRKPASQVSLALAAKREREA